MLITIILETFQSTTTMSHYSIPVHLPILSQSPNLPESPTSVSTSTTVGSPFSMHLYSSVMNTSEPPPSTLSQSQEVAPPAFPGVLDGNLLLSARKVRSEFLRRDLVFARLIVAILAQRIELGFLSPSNGIGFPFNERDERKVSLP